jgi:hypothetical protein
MSAFWNSFFYWFFLIGFIGLALAFAGMCVACITMGRQGAVASYGAIAIVFTVASVLHVRDWRSQR